MDDKNIGMAHRIAAAVRAAGGRTFFVGGCVRDWLLGLENKDIDIEVHGVPVKTLEDILDSFGERLTMGASFGVMGLRHYEIDIAMPRSETATGRGHRDFEVYVDPFLGEKKAARRRDFTMNALMQDVITGEILDFFGGRQDLGNRIIRHVDDRTFAEDPLRVFRAAQFAARFGFSVAEETVAISSGMDAEALAAERVMGELEKALLKAEKPSVFFEVLRRMKQLSVWFPEPGSMAGVPAEGKTAWDRSMRKLDAAAGLREHAVQPLWFMLAVICLEIKRSGADSAAAGRFLERLTHETNLKKYVLNMTGICPDLPTLQAYSADTDACMSLFDRSVCPEDLILLTKIAAGPAGKEAAAVLPNMLGIFRERMSRPFAMGRDLVAAGVRPGPVMGEALACAHRLRLAGQPKEVQLRQALAVARREINTKNTG